MNFHCTIKNADGSVYKTETITRNLLGQPTRSEARDSSNALILAQDFAYDTAHRPSLATDTRPGMPTPHSRSYAWSPGGLLNLTQDEAGHRTDYLYDATGVPSICPPHVSDFRHTDFSSRLTVR